MDGHGLQLVHFPPSWLRSVITVSLATVRLLQDLSLAAKFSSISRRTYWFFTKSQNKCTETLDITFFSVKHALLHEFKAMTHGVTVHVTLCLLALPKHDLFAISCLSCGNFVH